jgi:hypothetical protein
MSPRAAIFEYLAGAAPAYSYNRSRSMETGIVIHRP